MGLGGPVWHASAAPVGARDASQEWLKGLARDAIAGVGDPALGEWVEMGTKAVHVRRRLSEREQLSVGPVADVRGTDEAYRRVVKLGGLVKIVPPSILDEELGRVR